jgi:hypothetical protein
MMSNYDWTDPDAPRRWAEAGSWVEETGDINALQVDEEYWGEGSETIVKDWLLRNYDFETMPPLQVAEVRGKSGLWLLGWDREGNTSWPSLLPLIFGNEYADRQLKVIRQKGIAMRVMANGEYGVGMTSLKWRQP